MGQHLTERVRQKFFEDTMTENIPSLMNIVNSQAPNLRVYFKNVSKVDFLIASLLDLREMKSRTICSSNPTSSWEIIQKNQIQDFKETLTFPRPRQHYNIQDEETT